MLNKSNNFSIVTLQTPVYVHAYSVSWLFKAQALCSVQYCVN